MQESASAESVLNQKYWGMNDLTCQLEFVCGSDIWVGYFKREVRLKKKKKKDR